MERRGYEFLGTGCYMIGISAAVIGAAYILGLTVVFGLGMIAYGLGYIWTGKGYKLVGRSIRREGDA